MFEPLYIPLVLAQAGIDWGQTISAVASIGAVIGVVGVAISAGVWRGHMEARVATLESHQAEGKQRQEQIEKSLQGALGAMSTLAKDIALLSSSLESHKALTEQGHEFMRETVTRIEKEVRDSMGRLELHVGQTFERLRDDLRQSVTALINETRNSSGTSMSDAVSQARHGPAKRI